jgi:hypothetical protein
MEQNINNAHENRSAKRHPIFCNIEFNSTTGVTGQGQTRNMSANGVCFTTDKVIELDLSLRLVIFMQKGGRNMPPLCCEGKVVRVNTSEEGWEVAVNFTTFDW